MRPKWVTQIAKHLNEHQRDWLLALAEVQRLRAASPPQTEGTSE